MKSGILTSWVAILVSAMICGWDQDILDGKGQTVDGNAIGDVVRLVGGRSWDVVGGG